MFDLIQIKCYNLYVGEYFVFINYIMKKIIINTILCFLFSAYYNNSFSCIENEECSIEKCIQRISSVSKIIKNTKDKGEILCSLIETLDSKIMDYEKINQILCNTSKETENLVFSLIDASCKLFESISKNLKDKDICREKRDQKKLCENFLNSTQSFLFSACIFLDPNLEQFEKISSFTIEKISNLLDVFSSLDENTIQLFRSEVYIRLLMDSFAENISLASMKLLKSDYSLLDVNQKIEKYIGLAKLKKEILLLEKTNHGFDQTLANKILNILKQAHSNICHIL